MVYQSGIENAVFVSTAFWKSSKALSVGRLCVNPFTPKRVQFQISPAASQEILHHTVWRTWLFITYSDERLLYYQFSLPHLYSFWLKGWENVLFELGSESAKLYKKKSRHENRVPNSRRICIMASVGTQLTVTHCHAQSHYWC